ncbi:MAG: alpha/beta hydrolase [Pseudomonadales bacterium]|nr:alpha/beta hydrolase [Pseudomonadales bacterium]
MFAEYVPVADGKSTLHEVPVMARWDRPTSGGIPDWFWESVETKGQPATVEVEDCDVAYQTWGNHDGKPGVLLIHGMNAHKHWWDFIAPQLLPDYYVVAMDLTGMGDSDFRYEYDSDTYAAEIVAVSDAAGLDEQVVLVGHSFGGRMATKVASVRADRLGALVLVDSGIRHPDEPEPDYPVMGGGRAKVYPSREAAEARFRLFPPQPCDNEYLLTYIARKSLLYLDGSWGWKFDEELPLVLKNAEATPEDFTGLQLPVGLIYGANSLSFTEETRSYVASLVPNLVTTERIEDAQHHVFLDQPLAFVAALRRVLALVTRQD